jgi:type IV pilus assembly protein PilB
MPAGQDERSHAEALAKRYHAEFVDLKNFKIQHDLLRTVPVELMFRYNFVPIELQHNALVIAVSDPSRLMILDEQASPLPQWISHRHRLAALRSGSLRFCGSTFFGVCVYSALK